VAIASPAFGLGQALLDLFGRDDVQFSGAPAAGDVRKREFAEMSLGAPKGMDPRVVAGETRLAATFQVGGVRRQLWVAPTAGGGFCYVYEHLGGGCNNTPRRADQIQVDGSFVMRPGAEAPAMEKLAGIIFDRDASALRLTFEDGRTTSLRFVYVSEPIDAGFFAYNPTPAEQVVGHRPAQLTLLDAEAEALAEASIDWASEDRKAAEILKLRPRQTRR
jgi:hypothetical protein